MTIKHLDELDIKTFLDVVRDIDKFCITEKVDGAELVVGFDERGEFYTSREEKGGKKFYKESDWPKQFWTTGFRGAHIFLSNHNSILSEFLKPGDEIEVEILYGNTPNTVEYKLEHVNRVVLLRPINCEVDLESLMFTLSPNRKTNHLWLKDIPTTTNGFDYKLKEFLMQSWQFDIVPKLPAPKLDEECKAIFTKLLDYCHQTKDDCNNLAISLKRVTPKNKLDVLATRSFIQKYQKEFKDALVKQVLTNFHSHFRADWTEGVVYRHIETGFQFKLVDKEKFTLANKKKHEYINFLRGLYWKGFKNDLLSIAKIDWVKKENIKYFDDLEVVGDHNVSIPLLHFRCEHNIAGLNYSLKNYQGEDHKVLEEFCSLRLRTQKILEAFTLSTCPEHVFEAILFDGEGNLKHLKAYSKFGTGECGTILKEHVQNTYHHLWSLLDIEDLELAKLGSLSFAEVSGDMDIGIDSNVISAETIIKKLEDNHIKYIVSKGLNMIHCSFPVDYYRQGSVQLDLILTDKLFWTKFWFTGSTPQSKYKGLYRNCLLRAIAGSSNTVLQEEGDDDIYYRKGWVAVPTAGIEYQIKERPIGKKGKRIKTFTKTQVLGTISEPDRVIANLFQTYEVKPSMVQDFESLWAQVKLHKNPEEIALIVKIAIKILKEFKYKIPRELIYDL